MFNKIQRLYRVVMCDTHKYEWFEFAITVRAEGAEEAKAKAIAEFNGPDTMVTACRLLPRRNYSSEFGVKDGA